MNRAFIPLAAAATFVAVYRFTPAPAPAAAAAEPVAIAVAAAVPAPIEAGRPAAAAAERRADRHGASRPRRIAVPARRPAVRAVRLARQAASVHYSGCNEVRAAGLAPLYRGQPGYRVDMDGDLDGIACEPHRRR
jgi:hypothetical protein